MDFSITSKKEYISFLENSYEKIRNENKAIEAKSKYFKLVGSTISEDIPYDLQVFAKENALKSLFKNIVDEEIINKFAVEKSPQVWEYRFKMDFVASFHPFEDPQNSFGQRQKGRFLKVVDMHECNLIKDTWFQKVRKVYEFIHKKGLPNYDLKKFTGFLRYITIKEYDNHAMLLITTSSSENSEIMKEVGEFAIDLGFESVYWVVNETLRDDSAGRFHNFWGEQLISVGLSLHQLDSTRSFSFLIGPTTFFQNNIKGFELILDYTSQFIQKHSKNKHLLVDLFSGVGVIGISLANLFDKLLSYELVPESVALAKINAEKNNVTNIEFSTQDLNKKNVKVEIDSNSLCVIDPPRVGLQTQGVRIINEINPEIILYISCNPITQMQDIKALDNYKVIAMKGFDLFPHTHHVESVCILERI